MSSNGVQNVIWGEKDGDAVTRRHDPDTGAVVIFRSRTFENGEQKTLMVIFRADGEVHHEHVYDTSGDSFEEVVNRAQDSAMKMIERDLT